jgi:hypothetical protein
MSRLKMLPKSLISSRPEQRLHPRNGRYQRLERHRPSQLEFPRRNIALARFADDEAGAPARSAAHRDQAFCRKARLAQNKFPRPSFGSQEARISEFLIFRNKIISPGLCAGRMWICVLTAASTPSQGRPDRWARSPVISSPPQDRYRLSAQQARLKGRSASSCKFMRRMSG